MADPLCGYQEKAVARILDGLDALSGNLPSILMVGMAGSGKRTVAETAARRLGIEFAELRLDLAATDVTSSLFSAQGPLRQDGSALERGPGLLGHPGPLLLYLSHFEGLDRSLFQPFAQLLDSRSYRDGSGKLSKVSGEVWLVVGLTPTASANVGRDHWLTSRFDLRLALDGPQEAADFQAVALNCAKKWSKNVDLAEDLGDVMLAMSPIPDNLHAVRRWIDAAVGAVGLDSPVNIDSAALNAAIIADLSWAIRKIEYRGKRLELRHVNKWLTQIPLPIQPLAVQMVRQLAERYFMTAEEYYRALSLLIEQAAIAPDRVVSFCKWQPLGKSAAHLSHELKNQGRWKIVDDIDFALPESAWPKLPYRNPVFILTDDFVGTGRTLNSLTEPEGRVPVASLAKRYPDSTFVLLLLVAYEEPAGATVTSLTKLLGNRISIFVYRTLTAADRCFTSTSTIVAPGRQETLKKLCISSRAKYFPSLPTKFVYGYEQTGAFFGFFNSVPNNSLPILWHDQGTWFPLLPASKVLN